MSSFTLSQSAASAALSWVTKAIAGRTSLPILQYVHIEVQGGRATLSATDLSQWHQEMIDAEGEDAALTLEARRLLALIQSLPAKSSIRFTHEDGNKWRLSCGEIKTLLHSLPAEQFPMPKPEEENVVSRFVYPAGTFARSLASVTLFASKDETRPIICSVYLESKDGKLTFVGTDTHRLGRCTFPEPVVVDGDAVQVVIPTRGANTLHGLLSGQKEFTDAVFSVTKQGQLITQVGDTTLRIRLLEGLYPNYGRVIPTDFSKSVSVLEAPLTDALKRTELLGDLAHHVTFDITGDSITVNAECQAGEHTEKVEAALMGEDTLMAFAGHYWLDTLRVTRETFKAESIKLELNEPLRPGVVRAIGEHQDTWLCVLMPRDVAAGGK